MNMKYLLIVVSACFLLTCTTSCENGKNANDKNASEEVTEKNVDEEVKDDASAQNSEDDVLIRDFITNMYEHTLYNDEDFLKAHCTAKMLQYLKDQYEYDGEGYAGWLFRTASQDGKPGAEDVKDKVLSITKDSEGWYHYTFTDGGWHGENKMKVHVENGEVMVDELTCVYDEADEEYHREVVE